MQNLLITGGAGFIGSHVAERLLRDGHEIFVLDDLNDFYSPVLKQQNLDAVKRAGLAGFYHCDIRDAERTRQIIEELSPRVIIHLAARGGVRLSVEQPFLYEEVNVRGTGARVAQPSLIVSTAEVAADLSFTPLLHRFTL